MAESLTPAPSPAWPWAPLLKRFKAESAFVFSSSFHIWKKEAIHQNGPLVIQTKGVNMAWFKLTSIFQFPMMLILSRFINCLLLYNYKHLIFRNRLSIFFFFFFWLEFRNSWSLVTQSYVLLWKGKCYQHKRAKETMKRNLSKLDTWIIVACLVTCAKIIIIIINLPFYPHDCHCTLEKERFSKCSKPII